MNDIALELTPKQQRFIDEYFTNGFNATKAATAAGYSQKTANEQGARLLANVSIQEEVRKRCQSISDEYPLLRKRIIDKLTKAAFSDITDFLDYKTVKTEVANIDGEPILGYKTVVEVRDSTEVDGSLINEVQETRDGFKFKRIDSMKALELLGKYTGLESTELEELRKEIDGIKKLIERKGENKHE